MLKSPCLFGYSALCCFCETFFTREEGERGYKHKEYADHFGYFRGFNMPLFCSCLGSRKNKRGSYWSFQAPKNASIFVKYGAQKQLLFGDFMLLKCINFT